MKLSAYLLMLLLALSVTCDQVQTHKKLALDTPSQEQFKQAPFTGKYVFDISKEQVAKLGSERWFFFVEVEPDPSKEWVTTQIDLSVGKKDREDSTSIKKCDALKGGVDSCFLTNKQFDYVTDQVHVKVNCRGECKFKLSAQISAPYKLTAGKTIRMDFQNTAYSKIFTLDTTKNDNFDQLRIILRPDGFLEFPAPIKLYLNQDDTVPTKQRYDFKGMTLWDNGQGIFLDMPDAKGLFTILVEGPQKNVLMLQTQLISFTETNSIPQNLPFFDFLGEGSSKKYKVKVNPSKGVCLQMNTFSGGIKLLNILDQNLQAIDEQFAPLYRSYGELEYQLDAKFFSENKKDFKIDEYIVFEIEGVKESTFVLEAYQLNLNIAHLLPQRTRYVEIPSKKYHQYYVEIVELNAPEFKKAEFQIIITTEEKKSISTRFFYCKKDHGDQCQLKSSEVEADSIKGTDIQSVNSASTQHPTNGVQIHKFSIPASKFQKASEETKKYILVVLVQNKESEEQLYTIQFINNGKTMNLKQGQVKTDRVSIDQSKYYKYTNPNKDVKEIRAHVMEISGRVFVEGYLEDPRNKDMNGKQILDYHNAVRFPLQGENQTIYLKITGKESAYYSIQIQAIKDKQKEWWKKPDQKDAKGYNEVIIVEGIPYEFNIPAKSKEVFQVHSKQDKFDLDISSLLPLELCMTEDLKKPPFEPNCEATDHLTSKSKLLEVTLENGKIGNIGVTNNNEKDVKFNIRIIGIDNMKPIEDNKNGTVADRTDLKCLPGVLGKINKYNLKKNSSSCYSYELVVDKYSEDFEVIADVISDEYDKVNIIVEINGVQRVEVIGATHIFQKEELRKACNLKNKCPLKIFVQSQIDTEIRFTAEFINGNFYLLDGIAHQFTGAQEARHFVYELYNKVNTTIVLQNKNGYYKFYGKIVDGKDYWASNNPKFPTATDQIIESINPFYYLYQISVLTEAQIQQSKCSECLLLLSVVRDSDSYDKTQKSKFVIECTQQDRYLKQNTPVFAYLNHRSLAFYEFYNKQNGSILVSINSQNQECVKAYIKEGIKQRASASSSDKQTQQSRSTLVLQNAKAGEYSITLEALDNCYYSIDVTTSPNGLNTIEKGHFKDLTLDKHQQVKFIYENKGNETIKILTLHVNGQITIKAKSYSSTKDIMNDKLDKVKYDWEGKDFLNIQKSFKKYCTQCAYLIVIEAQKQTKTSIMIPQKDSEFPIVMDSYVKDELKKDEVELLRIFTSKISQFEISVHYGTIKIEILTSHNNTVEFSKIFEASKSTQYENVTTTPQKGSKPGSYGDFTFMRYNRVRITAVKDALFSFGFISNIQESKRGSKVKYGVPQYVNLEPKKRVCLRGLLDDNEEQFLISITGEKQLDIMNKLQISCEVNNRLLELNKNIAKNELIVTIDNAPIIKSSEYEFCMMSQENVFVTFIHSSRLNYFPQSQSVLVSKSMNLSFYSEGKSLIEINECKSRAIVSISRSFNTLGGMNSQIKQVRKTNNIIEFNQYGPVYIHVEAVTATVSWRRKNELTKAGYGYDEYSSNKIRIEKSDNYLLNVNVFPLLKVSDKPNVKFTDVEYRAFIAEEEMNLYDAMNCNQGTYIGSSLFPSMSQSPISIRFEINNILKDFGSKKYILVGALAIAKSPNDTDYRFIYPYQQILISALKSSSSDLKVEDDHDIYINPVNKDKVVIVKQQSAFNTFVLYFTLIVIIGFVGIWVYRKWIKKMLKRRRQQLSEQGTGEVRYQQFTSYT